MMVKRKKHGCIDYLLCGVVRFTQSIDSFIGTINITIYCILLLKILLEDIATTSVPSNCHEEYISCISAALIETSLLPPINMGCCTAVSLSKQLCAFLIELSCKG